jgi:AraC-like DNA-binding protein
MESFLKLTPSEDSLLNAALMPLLKIAREHSMGNDCKNGIYFSLTKSYLKNFLEIVNVTHPLSILGDEIIIGAASFIHNNFKQNISVTYLADKYCLEKNVFIRKFKKHLGITPYQYIKNLRLNYAASLIKEHRYPLSEIAEKSGYSDAASLSHAIKKTYGDYPKNLK